MLNARQIGTRCLTVTQASEKGRLQRRRDTDQEEKTVDVVASVLGSFHAMPSV